MIDPAVELLELIKGKDPLDIIELIKISENYPKVSTRLTDKRLQALLTVFINVGVGGVASPVKHKRYTYEVLCRKGYLYGNKMGAFGLTRLGIRYIEKWHPNAKEEWQAKYDARMAEIRAMKTDVSSGDDWQDDY